MRISDSEFNRLQVLKTIRRAEPVARTDIVKLTGLAGGTISQLTADFIRRGIVLEEKSSTNTFGRPRMELRINADAGHVLSVVPFGDRRVSIEIVDLKGDAIFACESAMERVNTLEEWARHLATLIDEAITGSPVSKRQIQRIGVVIHGVVDNVRGVVHLLAIFPDRDVPVAAIMAKQLQIPVAIDSGANVIARAEHWFGEENQLDNFTVIIVDLGLNCAHYVDGLLWRGAHGINPEFGHTKVVVGEGRRCYCGGTGCLVSYAGIFGIVSRMCELRGTKVPVHHKMIAAFRRFAAQARDGDEQVREVFRTAGQMLGAATANLINERDPGRILVATFEPELIPMISDAFGSSLKANTLHALSGLTDVRCKQIDVEHYRKGSAALALEHIYRG